MSLPQGFLDELKARTALADLIGRRVKLVRSGRELKGCCPFHKEKTPSFHLFDDHYHCFGCGAHGDAIRYLMEAEGQDFMGAVRQLADAAGMAVPEPTQDRAADGRAGLLALLERAAALYTDLLAGAGGAEARAYLAQRGISPSLARHFSLGWAPAGGIQQALLKAVPGATPAQLVEAGLVLETEDGRLRDRFRGRLIFPIHDARGRVVGFGGRLLGPGEPKYLNSADGPLFHKGRLLFNLHRAAPAARKAGRLFLVEGYMDAIALARVGIAEAVAPLGTAITEDQLELAWKVAAEPILAMDGDAAGQRAALKAALRALPRIRAGTSLRFLLLPSGEDPDDLVRRAGAMAFEELAARAIPLEQLIFDAEAAAHPLDTPERRAALRARLDTHARAIPDPALARDYAATWRARADRLTAPPRRGRGQARKDQPPAGLPPLMSETRAAAARPVSALPPILKALALRPELAEHHAEALGLLDIADRRLAAVRDSILAGNPGAALPLEGVMPLVPAGTSDEEFHAAIRAALASAHALSHLAGSAVAGMKFPDDGSTEVAYARASRARMAKAAILDGLKAQVIDDG